MSLSISHRFVSVKSDGSDATLVQPSNWNDTHSIDGFPFTIATPFDAQTPGGSLIVGSNTITLTPVPKGVNGTDSNHYLYISNGTGTVESVLITGGTAISEDTTGTVIVTCAHTHSGAWTIESATDGIYEAKIVLGGVGTIYLEKRDYNIRARLLVPTTISIIGQGTSASTLIGATGVNPCLAIADDLGTATGQGIGVFSNFQIYGPGAGTENGLWLGGDTAGVWAPVGWTASYTRFDNLLVQNFNVALYHRRANFVNYKGCAFSGITNALKLPSDGNGEHQPINFYDCVLTVSSGSAVVMDDSGFETTSAQFFGGQISGTVTGTNLDWASWGTHYEPNEIEVPILNITSSAASIISIHGGICSFTGISLASGFVISGAGYYTFTLKDVFIVPIVGLTITNLVTYSTSLGGAIEIHDLHIAPAGTVSNLYSVSKATLDAAVRFKVSHSLPYANTFITVGASIVFPVTSYPTAQTVQILGGTVGGSGITAVSGLTAYVTGILITSSIQTFTAGATIGNTITTVAGLPYTYFFDGTKIWVN